MKKQEFEFGWSKVWMNVYWVAGVATLACAVFLFSRFGSPLLQSFSVPLLLFSMNLFAGNFVWRASGKAEYLTLPLTGLFSSDGDHVLDAGCGSGRTTIALGRAMTKCSITAFDRFDAAYIKDGGRSLLERNIQAAGIPGRVRIEQGDVTGMQFGDGTFNAAISAYMFDHLKKDQLAGLREVYRVLRPGGKFLLIVMVPGWATFAVANVFCLGLLSRKRWLSLLAQAGFTLREEGIINTGTYFLVEK